MRIVVDTNIVFSAMLNTNSRIARIILQPKNNFNFYSTERLLTEIEEHSNKLIELSGYTKPEYKRVFRLFTTRIRFINIRLIPRNIYIRSVSLTQDVDIDDTEFVALTEHVKGKFWSGDKELKKGLEEKEWYKFVSTEELFQVVKSRK
jgi:predicted nucleic acid-binding protein